MKVIGHSNIYGISLHIGKSNYENTLEVVLSDYEVGQLRVCQNSDNSILEIDLALAYGKLDDLKKHNRFNIRDIDEVENRKLFDYKFDEIELIKNEVSKYSNIRIWVDHDDSNCYLLPLYFVYEFYDSIHSSNVYQINIDGFYKQPQTLVTFYDKVNGTEKELSSDDLKNYKNEWMNQLEINSEVRNVVDNKIVNLKYNDLYKSVLEFIKPQGRKSRATFIGELMGSNILNRGMPIIYNYIINCLAKDGKINVYRRENIDENDQFYDDEIRNNDIEYNNEA